MPDPFPIVSTTEPVWRTTRVGPLLVIADLLLLVEGHGVFPHLYADKSQLHGLCRLSHGI